jgi:hypothetical protein
VLSAQVKEGSKVCSLVAHIRPEDIYKKDRVLGEAQGALLSCARRQGPKKMFLVGLASKPFTGTCDGFFSKFGQVEDVQMACREFLEKGACFHGRQACRWQHPCHQVTIHVKVQVVA